ncbi:MAG: hypothetical protein V1886_02470 [archaeon]
MAEKKGVSPKEFNLEKFRARRKWMLPLFFIMALIFVFVFYQIGKNQFSNSGDSNSNVWTFPEKFIIGVNYSYDFAPGLILLLNPNSTAVSSSSNPLSSNPDGIAGSAIYTFYLGSGAGFPPMGLILGIDGVLRGTPTGKGGKFEVCIKDAGGKSACRTYLINTNYAGDDSNTNVFSGTGFPGTWEGTGIWIMNGPEHSFIPGCSIEVWEQFNFTQDGNELKGTIALTVTKLISACGEIFSSTTVGTTGTIPITTGTVTGTSAKFSASGYDYTAAVSGNTLSLTLITCHSPDPRCTGEIANAGYTDGIANPNYYETPHYWTSEFTAARTG